MGVFGLDAKHAQKDFPFPIFYLFLLHLKMKCRHPSQLHIFVSYLFQQSGTWNCEICGISHYYVFIFVLLQTLQGFLELKEYRSSRHIFFYWEHMLSGIKNQAANQTTHLSKTDWWLRDIYKIQLDFSTQAPVKPFQSAKFFFCY